MGIMRQIFGPSREEIWRQLCDETGAQIVKGTWLRGSKVVAKHGDWTVTLDNFVVSTGKTMIVFTRIRAPFMNPGGFRFSVHRRNLFTGLGKFFGMQDVEVGHAKFDHDFVIQGTDEAKLKRLFANPKIRELIAAQPRILFAVRDDEQGLGKQLPEGVDQLFFRVPGVLKDVKRLKQLYELFAETLEELGRLNAK